MVVVIVSTWVPAYRGARTDVTDYFQCACFVSFMRSTICPTQVTAFKESLMWVDGAADETLGSPRWKLFMFSPSIG